MNAYTDITKVLTGCQDGDSAALEALVRSFRPQVYRLALSILRDPDVARSASLMGNFYLIQRRGHWLAWAAE